MLPMDHHYIIPCICDGRIIFHIVQYDIPHTIKKLTDVLGDSPLPHTSGGHLSTHVAGVDDVIDLVISRGSFETNFNLMLIGGGNNCITVSCFNGLWVGFRAIEGAIYYVSKGGEWRIYKKGTIKTPLLQFEEEELPLLLSLIISNTMLIS